MIRAVVNQPKQPTKPEVEVLPPLFPPAPEPASGEEAAAAAARRLQVDDWRRRMRLSWDASRLEAALASSSPEEEEQGSPAGGAAASAASSASPADPADPAAADGGPSHEQGAAGEDRGGQPPAAAGPEGICVEQDGDDTTFHF